ncbi:MAG: EAL domain-containing protein [Rhodoferax sp.]|uniref:putative bifunctional diguanylate cyclase/phosphodiesterase n=1 Tax=Rhodoferax sp. TaxID=50421 RepID=UPI00261F9071|nr:EAL domain-containing protein [Rhodoferax sp.]MDD2881842.1 EAL domain-containing protein [Rhodoferax sp.]
MTPHPSSAAPNDLRNQLYRYAQDMQELMEQHSRVQARYQAVLQSQGRASLSNDLLLVGIREGLTPYLVTDSSGMIAQVNACTEPLLGAPGPGLRGLSLMQLVPRAQQQTLVTVLAQLVYMNGSSAILQCQIGLYDGVEVDSICQFDVLIVPLQTYAKVEFFWLLHPANPDMPDALSALQQFNLLNDSGFGLLLTDASAAICATNPAFTRITGFEASEVIGRNPELLSAGRHDDAFYQSFWSELSTLGSWSGEFFNRRKGGQIYPEWKTVKAVKNVTGDTLAYLSVFADGAHQRVDTDQLARMAYHDTLTGLPNRRLLEDRVAQSLSQAQRDGLGLSLLFIDLDRFKPINDKFGHEVGDQVLQEVARRLKKSVRQGDTAARVGGDEFVIMLQGAVRAADVESIASTVLTKLGAPIIVGGHKLLVGASIGCARYPQDGGDMVTLLKHADRSMYAAKRFGGNHFCLHEGRGDLNGVANLGHDLWQALERNEMHLVYQPQVTAGGALCGCEALLRWTHGALGSVLPLTFVPLAEATGAILPLGDWVLDSACRQLKQFQEAGLHQLTMAVNVSARQLNDPDFPNRVCQILLATGIAPHLLELEVTESEALLCESDGQQRLQSLRALGVKIAVDDFGTGFSSLSRLHTLPVDRLKIDQSFVRDLATSLNARAISQCFVSLGLAMGLEVVAEGVETSEQYQVLTNQGCHLIQGYFTGRPMTAQALLAQFKPVSPALPL